MGRAGLGGHAIVTQRATYKGIKQRWAQGTIHLWEGHFMVAVWVLVPASLACAQAVRKLENATRWEGMSQASRITGTLLSSVFTVPQDPWKVVAEDRALMWLGSWRS